MDKDRPTLTLHDRSKAPTSGEGCSSRAVIAKPRDRCTRAHSTLPGCSLRNSTRHWFWHAIDLVGVVPQGSSGSVPKSVKLVSNCCWVDFISSYLLYFAITFWKFLLAKIIHFMCWLGNFPKNNSAFDVLYLKAAHDFLKHSCIDFVLQQASNPRKKITEPARTYPQASCTRTSFFYAQKFFCA